MTDAMMLAMLIAMVMVMHDAGDDGCGGDRRCASLWLVVGCLFGFWLAVVRCVQKPSCALDILKAWWGSKMVPTHACVCL